VTGPVTQKAMGIVRRLIATYEESEDMINIGAYVKGSNPAIDEAISKHQAIEDFLIQAVEEQSTTVETLRRLATLQASPSLPAEIGAYDQSSMAMAGGAGMATS
jgi:flagellum-specific ATP synthase